MRNTQHSGQYVLAALVRFVNPGTWTRRKALTKSISMVALIAAMSAIPARAQGGAPGFDVTGLIQVATVDNSSNKLSGGYITINDQLIRVPANTIVQMPATTLSWGEVFSMAPVAQSAVGESGLAMADSARLPGTYEAHIQGNIIGTAPSQQYIAGLIFISQQLLNQGQGFIDSIDYAARAIHVNGKVLSINDPKGRYSGGIAHSSDQRFAVDEDNPTIRAVTAYPMCMPNQDPAVGDDPNCPRANRPKDTTGKYLSNFESGTGLFSAPGTDPTRMAPFEVGDYITYAGVLQSDGSIAAYQIIANVGIYTAPGADPAYVAIDALLQGTGASANQAVGGIFGIEATSKVIVDGFSTDPSRTVDAYAIDNLCGVLTDRYWATVPVDPGPPTGAKKGRFRYRPAGGAFLPPAREVRVRVTPSFSCVTATGVPCPPSGAETKLANGLTAGQYHAPNLTFVFPETLTVGGTPATNNFGDFVWLANGIGSWNGAITGRLDPWPDTVTPAPTCSATVPAPIPAPVASAVATPGTVFSGDTVTLDGSASTGSATDAYLWKQTSGPAVSISNATSKSALIVAPSVLSTTSLGFSLTISNATGTSSANATVTVNPKTLAPVASAVGTPASANSGAVVALNASGSTDPNIPSQTLSFAWTQTGGPVTVTQTAPSSAANSFTAPATTGTYQFQVKVTNTSRLFSTATVSVNVAAAALQNPVITGITATSPIASGGSGAITVNASDPNNQALTYKWTQTAGPAATITNSTAASTTFTAPILVPGSLGTTVTFAVTATDKSQLSANGSVLITVNPPPDQLQFLPGSVVYVTRQARLKVSVLDTIVSSNIIVTCTVPITNPATGSNYTATATSVSGTYLITFSGIPKPPSVSCFSNITPKNVVTFTAITVK
jgi:hypothetical protein